MTVRDSPYCMYVNRRSHRLNLSTEAKLWESIDTVQNLYRRDFSFTVIYVFFVPHCIYVDGDDTLFENSVE